MSFDIIYVNYKSTDYLLKSLKSVFVSLNGLSANVYVQDNNSEDNVDRIWEIFPEVRLSKNDQNLGFSKAVNQALKLSTSRYILLLNPDTLITDGFFEPVIQYLDSNTGVGILGPKVLNTDKTIQGSARTFPTIATALFGRNTLLTKLFPHNWITLKNVLTNTSDGITPVEVGWVSGACMMLRRQALNDVGYLDERFFIYWEDTDWCKRMWQKGWKVVYFPQTSVLHHVGGSTRKKPIRSLFEFHKSVYRLFTKYNKPYLRFLNPLVIGALALRLTLVLFVNRIGAWPGMLWSIMRASVLRGHGIKRVASQRLQGKK
jgi:GT2 family glycosyltransferase